MSESVVKLTPQELVQQKYPDSFVEDDGERVYIRTRKNITETCPYCQRNWTHKVVDYSNTIGAGGSESRAWEDAAKSLGLI